MKFNKSAIAICIGSALLTGSLTAHAENEAKPSYGATQQATSQYTVYLNNKPALENHVKGKHNYTNEAKAIDAQQQALFKQIKTLDPTAKLISKSRLLSNFITVTMTSNEHDRLMTLDNVKSVTKDISLEVERTNNLASISVQVDDTETEENAIEMMSPFNNNPMAGEGVTVAIISTGVDYTSAFFGGSGEYGEDNDPETPPMAGSYLEALENGAVGPTIPAIEDDPATEEDESADAIPGFDGFPTNTVSGGWDFASENYGNDANPIDQNLEGVRYDGFVYPTGTGTELASIVHQLAPAAKIHAYKVSNIQVNPWDSSQLNIIPPRSNTIIQALEHALDPNQDGDTTDHLDIALMDTWGAAAFFKTDARGGQGGSSNTQWMVEKASALGLTVVTHAGYGGYSSTFGNASTLNHRGWVSTAGSATNAITVGSAFMNEDGTTSAADWSPLGPVRGSKALKPEFMSYANNIPVSKISQVDSTAAKFGTRTDALTAAARVSAAAAVVKSTHPSLGAIEIKALLANTANNNDISEANSNEKAELLLIGHGIENVDAATTSPVAIWEKSSYQPYVQFGAHEVSEVKRVTKYVTLRNLSDSAQTYQMSYRENGMKDSYNALSFDYPASVSVPANASVEIAVTIIIDGNALPEWPLQSTEDFTEENLKATELNGYFTFTSDGNPELNVGWMLKARNETTIDKMAMAAEWPQYKGWNSELGKTEWGSMAWAEKMFPPNEWGDIGYFGLSSSFINESKTPTTFEAYPILISNPHEPIGKEDVAGHKIHAVGAAVYEDARCEITGKKLTVAVNFFQPAELAMANYTDKIGPPLFFYDLFSEAIVKDNGLDESFGGIYINDESQVINQPFVQLNDQGQPSTYIIDYNKEFDWNNPNGRYIESKLPVRFSNDSKNVVSEICLEEMFHHELDSVEDFDQNMGFHIETDRDSGKEKFDGIAQLNPLRGGYYAVEEICQDGWFGYFCETVVNDKSNKIGFASVTGENPIETAEFSHVYTAQPGEEVTIAAVKTGQWGAPDGHFMVMSTSDNYYSEGTVSYLDSDGGVVTEIRAGQEFSVDENAPMGTVVGTLKFDTAGFFSIGYSENQSFDLVISTALPGNPFAINQETQELYVANPAALDFENQKSFVVQIVPIQGQTSGLPQDVTVTINDVNDIAPELIVEVYASRASQMVMIDKSDVAEFTIDLSGMFVELEGQALTYSVSGSGLVNLSVDGTMVSGSVTEEGSYTATVTASDGMHEVMADFSVIAEKESKTDGSGSLGGMLVALAGLLMFRRRK